LPLHKINGKAILLIKIKISPANTLWCATIGLQLHLKEEMNIRQAACEQGERMALTESTMLELGTKAPDFTLPDVVSGKSVALSDLSGSKALLVIFMCAHCPYVKHIEAGLAQLGKDMAGKPVKIVAISSNDAATHPGDSPEGLRKQAEEIGFNFPYLYDESQEIAKAYNAACTPDFFLFDGNLELAYRGQFDSSRPGNGIPVTGEDVRFSISQLLHNQKVPADQIASIGCNIKWK